MADNKFIQYINIKQGVVILILRVFGIELVMLLVHFLMGKLIILINIHDIVIGGLGVEVWELILFHIVNTSWLLLVLFRWLSIKYIINGTEIFVSKGILDVQTKSYPIRGIQEVRVNQTILGRLLGYGSVYLYSPFVGSKISLKNIHHPNKCANLIREELNNQTNMDMTVVNKSVR